VSPGEHRLADLSNLLVGGTGVVYAVMRYLMTPGDEWAIVNHPWQPHVQHLHVVAAPLLVFAVGLIWKGHVREKLERGTGGGRATGIALVSQLFPMVASGYLIQVAVTPLWRTIWIWVHVLTGSLWLVAYVWHRVRRVAASARSSSPRARKYRPSR